MLLFLTNNFKITKPLYIWLLKQGYRVNLLSKKISKKDLKNVDLVISYNYHYIIKKELLDLTTFINLHTSYLPFNRGAYPNIFSIIENTKKGVTIHLINEGIDTGDILYQKRVVFNKNETLYTSYKKLHFHIQLLFKQNFKYIINKKFKPKKQKGKGTFHLKKDLEKIKLKDFNITIKEFLDENRKI